MAFRPFFALIILLSPVDAVQGSPAADPKWLPTATQGAEPVWALRVPALAPAEGVRLLGTAPARFPRPAATRGDETVPLPVEPDISLLRRDEGNGTPVLTWTVRADLADGGGGVLVADLFPSGAPSRKPWNPWDGAPPPQGERRLDTIRRQGWRTPVSRLAIARDPLRSRGPDPSAVEALRDRLLPAVLVALPITATTEETLVATADGGSSWLALRLEAPEDSPEAVHVMYPEDVLGISGSDEGRVVVAPRPLGPRSTIDLLEVDKEGRVTSLGSIGRRGANWAQRVTAVRAGRGGALEGIVLVHDLAWPPEDRTDSWGAVVRRTAEGTWADLARFALPETVSEARVRFAADRDDELVLSVPDGPTRRLRLPALAAGVP